MGIVLVIGIVLMSFSLFLLKFDVKELADYKNAVKISQRELDELNALKNEILSNIDGMMDMLNSSSSPSPLPMLLKLESQGLSPVEIAHKMNMGVGEVQTILRLQKLKQMAKEFRGAKTL